MRLSHVPTSHTRSRQAKVISGHYMHPRLAALYDTESPWSESRHFYLDLAGSSPLDILELGAGTGIVARAMAAKGHRVVAMDPAQAMRDVGRDKPNGNCVEWVHGTHETARMDRTFDLIFMTGNAFQEFQSRSDAVGFAAHASAHLKPGGQLAFETRNPNIDWAAEWSNDWSTQTSDGSVKVARRIIEQEPEYISFETSYDFGDEVLTSKSRLQFLDLATIETMLQEAGLKRIRCFGDWSRAPFDPHTSRPIIFVAHQ